MKRLALILLGVLAAVAGAAPAAVVTQRWGVKGRVQHAGALLYEDHGEAGKVMRFDLSALPPRAKVHRARLVFFRSGRHGSGFDIVPVRRQGGARGAQLKPAGRPLVLVEPHKRWFDATEAVRAWVKAGEKTGLLWLRAEPALLVVAAQAGSPTGLLWARQKPGFDYDATFLEIAYEGQVPDPPKQVTGVKAFYRSGQVFITFREVEDYDRGKDKITWKELDKRFRGLGYHGPQPRDDKGELRYRVYMHGKPVTPATIGEARLIGEVAPGSGYNTRLRWLSRTEAVRVAVEPGKRLGPGVGVYVHTVRRHGKWHYAVVTARDGVENTVAVSEANAAGPIDQRPAAPEPVLQEDKVTALRGGGKYHQQWYALWAEGPLAPRPFRYDLAVGFCPDSIARPAAVAVIRGHFTCNHPEMPAPARRRGIVMGHSADGPYHGLWTGVNDAEFTLKGTEQGAWQPFVQRRQEAIIRWMRGKWQIDPERISVCTGSAGMWEIRRGDLYAYIHGWGMPELSKGFQCWHWANGVWGPPDAYKGKPDDQNPFVLQDYTTWVLSNPEKELPFFNMHTGWGDHFTEQGWPPFPRFVRAMMDTKRAFCMHSQALSEAMGKGLIRFRRDQSLPAFANCSLDDNIGEGDLRSARSFGRINAHLVWESATIVDEPGLYAVTVQLWHTAPLPECTVDLTPRRCRNFKGKPAEKFVWTNTTVDDGRLIASGEAAADKIGLVTVGKLKVTKARHRITIRRK